jgi:hypothetical protein
MSRIKPLIAPVLKMLALLIATAVALGPLSAMERAEDAVFGAWRAVGDQLAQHALTELAQQLDRERQDAERIQGGRDNIATRLFLLEAERELLAAEIHESSSRTGERSTRELAVLDCAISVLKSTANRADRVLLGASDQLRARRVELSSLQAHDDARRMNQALARPIGDPALWSSHVARAGVSLVSD